MRNKELIALKAELAGLKERLKYVEFQMDTTHITIEQARERDYIVRTNYIGRIKDKKIKDDFKAEIEKECGDKFDSITTKLLNYQFFFNGKNILSDFRKTLQTYEYKQIVMDTYGTKA